MKILEAELNRALSHIKDERRSEYRHNQNIHLELHPSGFPACILRRFLLLAKVGPFENHWAKGQGEYYTSVGSTVHTMMQKWMGTKLSIIGDWVCKKCGDIQKFSTASNCCGKPRHYEELGVTYKKTIKGHIDGLVIIKGKYYLIDYKTSSVKKITEQLENGGVYPLRSNYHQIQSYVVLLEKCYNIQIEGWALIYLARDNPFANNFIYTEAVTDEMRKTQRKRVMLYEKQQNAHNEASGYDENVEFLIKTKLCQSREEYDKEYKDDFNPCPFVDVCFKPNKFKKQVIEIVEESKFLPLINALIQKC